jgi:hypothetical protein
MLLATLGLRPCIAIRNFNKKESSMKILYFLNVSKIETDLNLLNNSLSEYGLKPNEWNIIKENCGHYKILNKTEPDFFFRGKIKYEKGRKKWGSIQLAGL